MSRAIPVIDITSALNGQRHAAVRQIRYACEEIGFLQLVGHGVDLSLLNRVYDAADALIALPASEKEAWVSPTGHPFRGWKQRVAPDAARIQERFQACNIDNADAGRALGIDEQWLDYFHPNVWPTVPGFKSSVRECFEATSGLGKVIMSLFAEALELPADYFDGVLEHDVSCFAMNIYPGEVASPSVDDPTVVLNAHTDSGTLTILHQRGNYEGLQVKLPSGDWHTVPIIDEAFVINIGDLMARWTNDKWVSTLHRVIAPQVIGQQRTSLTTFYTPAIDTVITPLPTCVPVGEAPRYGGVTQHAWEREFLARSYAREQQRQQIPAAV